MKRREEVLPPIFSVERASSKRRSFASYLFRRESEQQAKKSPLLSTFERASERTASGSERRSCHFPPGFERFGSRLKNSPLRKKNLCLFSRPAISPTLGEGPDTSREEEDEGERNKTHAHSRSPLFQPTKTTTTKQPTQKNFQAPRKLSTSSGPTSATSPPICSSPAPTPPTATSSTPGGGAASTPTARATGSCLGSTICLTPTSSRGCSRYEKKEFFLLLCCFSS